MTMHPGLGCQRSPSTAPFPHGRTALLLALLLPLASGCQALRLGSSPTDRLEKTEKEPALNAPGKHSLRVSQYVFFSDFDLKPDTPLLRELTDLREEVQKELRLPFSNSVVQVFLFEDRERYERFMHAKYPELPRRRAFFVAQPRAVGGSEDLLVYTFWGERIRQDLRHELTHALLHSVLRDVPLWLDEGLAEYFEMPPEVQGINQHHLEQLRAGAAGPFKPDLTHLEQLTQVQQMMPTEYREAWAWAHLLLRDRPEAKDVLVQYLQQLRGNPSPGPLEPRLAKVYADLAEALSQHLAKLNSNPLPAPTVQR